MDLQCSQNYAAQKSNISRDKDMEQKDQGVQVSEKIVYSKWKQHLQGTSTTSLGSA